MSDSDLSKAKMKTRKENPKTAWNDPTHKYWDRPSHTPNMIGVKEMFEQRGYSKEDASFIVKCVNSHTELVNEVARLRDAHEELLEALKDLVRFNVNSPEFLGAKAIAQRLIAKAEGKE